MKKEGLVLYIPTEDEIKQILEEESRRWLKHHTSFREPFKSNRISFIANKIKQAITPEE